MLVPKIAIILRSHTATTTFTMTNACHTSLARCHFPNPRLVSSSLRKGSAVLHLFQGVCWDWLEPEAERERLLLLFQASRLGARSLPEELSVAARAAPDPHSQRRPRGSVSQLTEAFLSGIAFVSEVPPPAPDGTRRDGRLGSGPWYEFWVWNMRPGVCVLKSFNSAFSNNSKWQRVAASFCEPSRQAVDLEPGGGFFCLLWL